MAQVWPNPDEFDHVGSFGASIGTYLIGYVGVKADAGTVWAAGKLATRALDASSPDAMTVGSSAYEGRTHGFVRREQIDEVGGASGYLYVDVTAYVRSPSHGGSSRLTAPPLVAGGIGAIARLIGGTLVEPGAGVYDPVTYLSSPSFYAARLVGVNATQVDLILERWNAGTRTQLTSRTLTLVAPSMLVPFILRLEAQNGATDVTLTVSLKNIAAREGLFGLTGIRTGLVPSWSSLTTTGEFEEALSYVDSSGSRLASPGRAGFVLDKENLATISGLGSVQSESHCRALEIGSSDGAIIRDEWRRSARVGRDEVTRWGDAGQNAQTDAAFDRSSESFRDAGSNPYVGGATYLAASGFTGFPLELDTGGSTGLELNVPINTPAQEQLALLPRETPTLGRARMLLTFEHDAVGVGEAGVEVGLVLRQSQAGASGDDGSTLDNFSGYVFSIDGDGLCSVRRRQYAANVLNGNPFDNSATLATLTISHSATSRTLEAECVDDDTSDPEGTGPALLRMWIDGVQIPFTDTLQAGVTVAADGTLRDSTFQRLPGARGVGIYFATPETDGSTTHRVMIHEIERVEPTGYQPPDDELATIELTSETSAAVGTLTWTPSVVLPADIERTRLSTEFVSGNRALRPATQAQRRRWSVQTRAVLDSELQDLHDFQDVHGRGVPFTWTIPGRAAAVFKFASGISAIETGPGLWSVEFELVELVS